MTDEHISTFGKNLFRLKAELLCYGVKVEDEKELVSVNPYFTECGFIHGSHLMLENGVSVNVAVNERFVRNYSPFLMRKEQDDFIVYRNSEPQSLCQPLLAPSWLEKAVAEKTKVADIVRPHGKGILFSAPIKTCVFSFSDQKCHFCTFNSAFSCEPYPPEIVARAIEIALAHSQKSDIAFGGATPNLLDFGASYYVRIISQVRDMSDTPISVEIVPPQDRCIDSLCDAGVDALIMNLEIFDDKLRRIICPGKSKISKRTYFEAWRYAVQSLGEGRVSTVLIAGLEDAKTTLFGAEEIVREGVIPTIIPFRPYDSCFLSSYKPTSPEILLFVAERVSQLLEQYGLDPNRQPGCTRCGACSLEKHIPLVV